MGVFRVVISALDAANAAQTIVLEDGPGRTLSPTDTPANAWAYGGLMDVPAMRRDMFSGGAVGGQSRRSFGMLRFANPDGLWDHLSKWAFDGRACTVYWSEDPDAAFPSAWEPVQSMTMRRCLVAMDSVEIEIRDGQEKLEQPIQTELYDGDNVLPAGLEGVEDLEGKPKPLVFGQVRNVPLVEVNSARVIYQASSEALHSVVGVYERGILLSGAMKFTSLTSGFGSTDIKSVAYGAGLWVIAGGAGTLRTSPDGVTWTTRTSQFGASDINEVRYGGGLFVAVGAAGKLSTSTNGTDWTARTSGFGASRIDSVAWTPILSQWVAVGNDEKISSSSNGTDWTARTSDWPEGEPPAIGGICFVRDRWLAVGGLGTKVTSLDGVTWTHLSGFTALFDQTLQSADADEYGQRAVLMYTAGSKNFISSTTPDALQYTFRPATFFGLTTGSFRRARHGGGLWLAVGSSGTLASSHDGDMWTQHYTPTSADLYDAAWSGSQWLVVGAAGALLAAEEPTTYATEADLLNNTLRPIPGAYKSYLAGGMVRLGSSPRGQVTADVIQGANVAARTVGQGAAWIWARMGITAGTAAGNYIAADVTALDALVDDVVGWWRGSETSATELLDLLALSARAWWGVDRLGRYRIERVVDPADATPAATFGGTGIPMAQDIRVLQAPLPIYRAACQYSRNHQMQDTDLVAGVSEGRKALLRQPWLEVVTETAAVRTRHPLSEAREMQTALADRADASARATAEMALFSSQRRVLECSVDFDATTLALDLGDVITVVDTRLGLSAGVKGLVVHVDPDPHSERITFGLWMSA